MRACLVMLFVLLSAVPAFAFGGGGDGCGAGDCRECHSLDVKEAQSILGGGIDKVHNVEFSEMPGLFVIDVEKDGQKFPLFLDFSKEYIVSGNIISLKDGRNIARERLAREPEKEKFVDTGRIPLEDALLLGRKDAATKVIVFTDPECPYCAKLHEEMIEVTENHPDIAYLIKMMPLPMHRNAYPIAQNVICDRDMNLLELSFASIGNKQQLQALAARKPSCETGALDQNLAVAGELGIRSTPTLVYPNGLVDSGYKEASKLVEIARNNTEKAE